MNAQLHSGARCLKFGLSLNLHPHSMYASRNGSDETADQHIHHSLCCSPLQCMSTKISFAGPNMVRYFQEIYLGNVVFNLKKKGK